MAESSKDIESGCDRPKSALSGEKETLKNRAFNCAFKLATETVCDRLISSLLSYRKYLLLSYQKSSFLLSDKKLRNIAFILAVIDKAANTLGTMNFIWATVILLGGFSQSLKSIDFWFVNIILVIEGLRILCRQGELKIKAMTWWSSSTDFMLQMIHQYSLAIQQYSAIACIVLSSLRIHKQQYGSDHNMNRNRALNLFYWLSVVESCLTVLGFGVRLNFSEPPISTSSTSSDGEFDFEESLCKSVLREVGFVYSQRFLYDVYCRCMNGSVFDGLKMDFVSYSVELLQSIDDNKQLEGARVLSVVVKSDLLPSERLRLIGTTPGLLEKLIELLSWEKPEEQDIRRLAGEIICKLVETPRNRIRVMAIPESMGSIKSMLYDSNQTEIHRSKYPGQPSDESGQPSDESDQPSKYNYSNFSVLGKRILKILGNDPDNRAKMGTSKELPSKITELPKLNSDASEIVRHLEITPMETPVSLARQQDVRENINGTSGFGTEHSDDPNSQSVDRKV